MQIEDIVWAKVEIEYLERIPHPQHGTIDYEQYKNQHVFYDGKEKFLKIRKPGQDKCILLGRAFPTEITPWGASFTATYFYDDKNGKTIVVLVNVKATF